MLRFLLEGLRRPLTGPRPPVDPEFAALAASLNETAQRRLGHSLSIRQVDAGSCKVKAFGREAPIVGREREALPIESLRQKRDMAEAQRALAPFGPVERDVEIDPGFVCVHAQRLLNGAERSGDSPRDQHIVVFAPEGRLGPIQIGDLGFARLLEDTIAGIPIGLQRDVVEMAVGETAERGALVTGELHGAERKTAAAVYDAWNGKVVSVYHSNNVRLGWIPYLGLAVDDGYRDGSAGKGVATIDIHKTEATNGCIMIVDPGQTDFSDAGLRTFEPQLILDVLAKRGIDPAKVSARSIRLGVMRTVRITL